jgi:hypothetical protein
MPDYRASCKGVDFEPSSRTWLSLFLKFPISVFTFPISALPVANAK